MHKERNCRNNSYVISSQIVIPFFSLLIKDIYFLNEGCANRLPNGHVNFEVSRACVLLMYRCGQKIVLDCLAVAQMKTEQKIIKFRKKERIIN